MFDIEDPKQISALNSDIEQSQKAKKPFDEQYVALVRKIVGKHYGTEGSSDNRPINMIETGVNTYQRLIASNNTQVMVDSMEEQLLPGAADLQEAMNGELHRINVDEAFNDVSLGALLRFGLMEVGITTDDTPPDGKGNLHDPGHVFADDVPLPEAVLDMKAKKWEQMRYIGHDYPVPLDWAKSNRNFRPEGRAKITAPQREPGQQDTDLNQLSSADGLATTEFEDVVNLRQIYLPRHQLVLTLYQNTLLNVVEWEGPEHGPYHGLGFGKVKGNIIPSGIIPSWHDLDDIANRTFCKLADQIERQKTVTGVESADKEDGERLLRANDGDMVKIDNAKGIVQINSGGANEQSLAAVMWIKQLWDFFAGNVTSLAGLGAMSRTVGQDQLAAGAANARIDDMRDRMMKFKQGVLEDIAFWMWTDPVRSYPIYKSVGQTGYGIASVWSPESRMGNFRDYKIRVNQFTERNSSPEEKAAELLKFVVEILPALMPAMQAQGIAIDAEFIIKELARCTNNPSLGRAVLYLNGEQLTRSGQSQAGMPANTTRTYERTSRPQPSQIGRENAMIQQMFNGGANADQLGQVAGMAG